MLWTCGKVGWGCADVYLQRRGKEARNLTYFSYNVCYLEVRFDMLALVYSDKK